MAERVVIDPRFAFEVPDQLADDTAAALGNAGLAAWLAVGWHEDGYPRRRSRAGSRRDRHLRIDAVTRPADASAPAIDHRPQPLPRLACATQFGADATVRPRGRDRPRPRTYRGRRAWLPSIIIDYLLPAEGRSTSFGDPA